MQFVPVDRIILHWNCECGAKAKQPLSTIVEMGTAVCPLCDNDMELTENVEIQRMTKQGDLK